MIALLFGKCPESSLLGSEFIEVYNAIGTLRSLCLGSP